MGASWKLQCEIDHVLKKVQEGVDAFDSIWNKVYDTDNANLREKYIKVIRKLVKYRDQIKTWLLSTEIKDMKVSVALMEGRKLIECEMERYKIRERETKTKAFSSEGLSQEPKMDPKKKAKFEARDWLNNVVSELVTRIDSFEAEMEGLSVKKGKTRPPRLTHLEISIVRHKAHVIKLELILRQLDNDELSPEQVNDVKDFLEDYVDRNQEDFDEFSDVDELYSSLPLDKESLEDLVTVVPPSLVKGFKASRAVVRRKPSLGATPAKNPATASTSIPQVVSAHNKVDESTLQNTDSDLVARKPPPKSSALSPSVPQTPPTTHTSPGAAKVSTPGIMSGSTEEEKTNFIGQRSSPALGTPRLRAWAGLPAQPSPTITIPPGCTTAEQALVPPLSREILPQAPKASDGHGSSDTGSLTDAATLGSVFPASSASPLQQPSAVHLPYNQKTMISTTSKDAETDLTKVEEFQQQPLTDDPSADSGSITGAGKNFMAEGELRPSYAIDTPGEVAAAPVAVPSTGMRDIDLSPGQPSQLNLSAGSHGIIGRRSVSDLGAVGDNLSSSISSAGMLNEQQLYNLQMLEAAYHIIPPPKDSECAKNYTPRHPAITPASYPQDQAPFVNNPCFWERLGPDTNGTDVLFFSFFYQQNTYQQYLAAKELKRRSWRYHQKYNTWFQRRKAPLITTFDFEYGSYAYFDFHIANNGWRQRNITDFTLLYSYLEDKLNV